MNVRKSLRSLVLFGVLSAALACDKAPETPEVEVDTLHDQRAREDVAALTEKLPELLDAYARRRPATHDTLATFLEPREALDASLPAPLRRELVPLRSLYAQRKFSPLWFDEQGELNSDGLSWLAMIEEVETTHGLFAQDLYLAPIQDHLAAVNASLEPIDAALLLPHRQALHTWFSEHAERFQHDADNTRLIAALLDEDGPLHPLAAEVEARHTHHVERTQHRLNAELLLSGALARYAREMRLDNPAWTRQRDWGAALTPAEDASKEARAEIDEKRRQQLLIDALSPLFSQSTSLRDLTASLLPPFEQYERLIQSYRRYQKIVAEGGWKPLPEGAVGLDVGASSPLVKRVKERLRAELMWDGDDSELYTKELADAVTHYQHTHQVWEKGAITLETWRSMNVPAERRLLRVRYAMERTRELRIGADEDFVYVNIPDFHGEVWEQGERKMRFDVVTGSAMKVWDEKTREHTRPRATQLFSDELEYIVFNPYWNVPRGIVEEEILPKLAEEPDYLETHNYEWHETSPGNRVMRQKPGPDNALGLVKFLFPNEHDIYLHDTNQKGYFRYPIRAFSHGCVRVSEPMALAEYLLRREGKWQDGIIEKYTRPDGGESWIKLEEPLPIHIEYVVVRVDDEGHAHFLADIYNQEAEPMTRISARSQAFDLLSTARQLATSLDDEAAVAAKL